MEKILITEALNRHQGSCKLAVKVLGIDNSTLYQKMKVPAIKHPQKDGSSRKSNKI